MQDKIAKAISYVLHPLLMPTYGVLLLFYQVESYLQYIYPSNVKRFFTLLILLLTFLTPSLISMYLVMQKKIDDLNMYSRKQRLIPLSITLVIYILTYVLLVKLHVNYAITSIFLSTVVSVLVTLLITFFWKISAHMIGISGITGTIYALYQLYQLEVDFYLPLLFFLVGCVGFARIQLQQHTTKQVLIGSILGFLICFSVTKTLL